jgi:2-oxoglutarate dehydrogenase E2 component (dihydrolipoamide succinyltransferase)
MPAAERMMAEKNLPAGSVKGTGPGGRVLKEDVARHTPANTPARIGGLRETKTIPLSPIRQTIAQRLVSAQQTAALLTTFNEVDMSAVKKLRETYRDGFEKKYGIKLGFMSFFVRAVVSGLQQFPALNAQMEGKHLIHHNYCDIGIAVGGGKGLVVPVLRNAENLSFADIEVAIAQYGAKAKNNQLSLEELEGGTFTITNGGVYGSLLSTPIVNPPQSGVLGMHGIFDRPVAVNGEVVIRPMMYIALTYDHRVVDGREAVSFLKFVKEMIEDPTRLILEV